MTEKEELKPLNCDPDARRWADEFFMCWNRTLKPDYNWMVGWFANAIMCGSDTQRWKMEKELSKYKQALERIVMVQLDPNLGQIVESEHYEKAWLDCIDIANKALGKEGE